MHANSTTSLRKANAGHFRKGHDPRRHKFTTEECQRGFWAMLDSIMRRYPDAITSWHAHMCVNALPALIARKAQGVN